MVSSPFAQKASSSTTRNQVIAMVWAPDENRTSMYAQFLRAPIFNIHYLLYKRPFVAPIKYIAQAFKTWWVLLQQRPKYIYITNPPVFAPLCVFVYCKLSRARYVMDTHSPALFSRKWGWTLPLQRFLAKHAYVNVVDQVRFKEQFESWGAKAIILEKPPRDTDSETFQFVGNPDEFSVAVVNTFAVDEPVDIIIEAARRLPDAHFYIMGATERANPDDLKNVPPNVTFTGYLKGKDYWNRLYSSRAVMALTTYPYSLLAGAQDGADMKKPLILSKQPALEEYFNTGAVFAENTADGLVAATQEIIANEEQLKKDVIQLAHMQAERWRQNFQMLKQMLEIRES